MQIQNLRVLITGPARGIGAETARQLAAQGAKLALVGLEPDLLKTLCEQLGPEHIWLECDVSDSAAMKRSVETAVKAFGGLDVVIANAGICCIGTVAIAPIEALIKTVEVNLIGVINTVHTTLPAITETRGYYLLISSSSATIPSPGAAVYSATKSAVEDFGTALRLELFHKGIAVGVAMPSWIESDMFQDQLTDLESFNGMIGRLPWPLNIITSVEKCAELMVDAVKHRQSKLFIPSSLWLVAFFRQFIKSLFMNYFLRKNLHQYIPECENEVTNLGRSFGVNSMGTRPLNK